MQKNELLYVSPFWPCKTGISEYSEALIGALSQYFDITLLTDGYMPSDKGIVEKYEIISDYTQKDISHYKYILYNFGNNPDFHSYMYDMILEYPGYIILHDYVLYYLTAGYYMKRGIAFRKIYEMEGVRGINIIRKSLRELKVNNLLELKKISAELPLNKEIIENAKGVFVHSAYSLEKILSQNANKKVFEIPHLKTLLSRDDQKEQTDFLRSKFNLKKDEFILGSIGLIGPSKQNELVCQAVNEYNRVHSEKIVYIMCGDGNYVDDYLNEYIIKTGFLHNREFFRAIKACDLIVNLRYPYNGEASGTLIQCMDMKKKCIATDIGWFSELPDEIIEKVPVNISPLELCNVIERVKTNQDNVMLQKAHEYVNEKCGANYVAAQIYKNMCEITQIP